MKMGETVSPGRYLAVAGLVGLLVWGSAGTGPGSLSADRPLDPRPSAVQEAGPLTEPGNAGFAAVAEVVQELEARPETDWSRVDLEALLHHLRDMEQFTLHAEVVRREEVPGGLRVAVTGTTPEARGTGVFVVAEGRQI